MSRPDITIGTAAPPDVPAVLALLARTNLPRAGLLNHVATTLVAKADRHVVGGAALEIYLDRGASPRRTPHRRGFRAWRVKGYPVEFRALRFRKTSACST